jgi:hypothetical protein
MGEVKNQNKDIRASGETRTDKSEQLKQQTAVERSKGKVRMSVSPKLPMEVGDPKYFRKSAK